VKQKEKRTVAIERQTLISIVSSILSFPASISRANHITSLRYQHLTTTSPSFLFLYLFFFFPLSYYPSLGFSLPQFHHVFPPPPIRVPATMADAPTSPGGGGSHESGEHSPRSNFREQDRFLPIANISRIMKKALPANGKIAKDAKETVQECVSEFISFITSEYAAFSYLTLTFIFYSLNSFNQWIRNDWIELMFLRASDKCQREKRKTINGDDLLWAMATLGFEEYVDPLKIYLASYREVILVYIYLLMFTFLFSISRRRQAFNVYILFVHWCVIDYSTLCCSGFLGIKTDFHWCFFFVVFRGRILNAADWGNFNLW